eukprot:UN16034
MTIMEKQIYIGEGGEQVFMGFLHSVLSVSSCAYGFVTAKEALAQNVSARYDYLQKSDFDHYTDFLLNGNFTDATDDEIEEPGRRNLNGVEFLSINFYEFLSLTLVFCLFFHNSVFESDSFNI